MGARTPPKRRSAAGTALGRSSGSVDEHFSGEGGPSWLVLVWGKVGELVGTQWGRWGLGGAGGDQGGERSSRRTWCFHGSWRRCSWWWCAGIVGAGVGVGWGCSGAVVGDSVSPVHGDIRGHFLALALSEPKIPLHTMYWTKSDPKNAPPFPPHVGTPTGGQNVANTLGAHGRSSSRPTLSCTEIPPRQPPNARKKKSEHRESHRHPHDTAAVDFKRRRVFSGGFKI